MRSFITQSASRLALALLTGVFVLGAPVCVASQPVAAAPKIRAWSDPRIATLVLVEDLGQPGAHAVVVRRPGELPNNIILVTRSTTPAELATAATALINSLRNRGDKVEREMRAFIGAIPVGAPPPVARAATGSDSGRPAARTRSERLAASDLARLRRAPEFTIPGVARGPALVIRMSDGQKAKKG
jgi:hypothetical protein